MFFVVMFVFILFSGCSQSSAGNPENTVNVDAHFDAFSDQLNFAKSLGSFPSMVASESGYYFIGGHSLLKYLFYIDKATMSTVVLCNKPDCLHMNETDRQKREYCNAYLGKDHTRNIGDLLLYGSNLYYFRIKSDIGTAQYLLTQASLDNTQQKDIFEFKQYPQYIIMHRGYLYYSTSDNGTVAGKEDSTVSKSGIYRVPMDDLKKKPELIYENNAVYAQIGGLLGYQDSVYFICDGYKDSKMENQIKDLMRYNIDSGNASKIADNSGRSAVCANKLVYSIDDEHLAVCDLDGSNKKTLDSINGFPYCDDKYIVTDTILMKLTGAKDKQGNPVKGCIYIYDLTGKELQSFDLDGYANASVFGGDSNYIFLTTTSRTENENKEIYEYWRIDKSKIENASAEMEKFYSYSQIYESITR
jgi:hypothetical protein